LHRVVVPKVETTSVIQRRQSIAYFCNVNGGTVVEPISTCLDPARHVGIYDAVVARDYLMAKHMASMAADAEHRTETHSDEL
jgi:isopenicillin N synthase-like dioxygenase